MASKGLPTTSSSAQNERQYHININPPLLNSSNPWATSYDDLLSLYNSPYTGAVTTRTSLWSGFTQAPETHQYTFFSPTTGHATAPIALLAEGRSSALPGETSSLNTLGYSPIPFTDYTKVLINMSQADFLTLRPAKPFIMSVTGTPLDVAGCLAHLLEIQNSPEKHRWRPTEEYDDLDIMMEINLSCPNIPEKPPPAYDGARLAEYISAISTAGQFFLATGRSEKGVRKEVHVGIKTPPYTYAAQFEMLVRCLEESTKLDGGCPISFITACNTLGSCLVLDSNLSPALGSANGSGIGGMAGEALHPLALGNVKTLREMLDASPCQELRQIALIGIGGVSDGKGFERMRKMGAMAVGVGTALGREGVSVFEKIGNAQYEEFFNL